MNKKSIAISTELILNGSVQERAEKLLQIVYGESFNNYSQEEITGEFDSMVEELKNDYQDIYSEYHNKFREKYVDMLVDFSQAFVEDDNKKTVKDYVMNILKDIISKIKDDENFNKPKSLEEKIADSKSEKEFFEKVVYTVIREDCWSPVVKSYDEKYYFFHSKISSDKFWVILKDVSGIVKYSFIKTPKQCDRPMIHPEDKYIFVQEAEDTNGGCFYSGMGWTYNFQGGLLNNFKVPEHYKIVSIIPISKEQDYLIFKNINIPGRFCVYDNNAKFMEEINIEQNCCFKKLSENGEKFVFENNYFNNGRFVSQTWYYDLKTKQIEYKVE